MTELIRSTSHIDTVCGSGNVFRDLGHTNADREQLWALLAARIIGVLAERKLTVRAAHELSGIVAADFSRIRQTKLDRFTIDRLMTVLAGLDQDVEVTVNVHPRTGKRRGAGAAAILKRTFNQYDGRLLALIYAMASLAMTKTARLLNEAVWELALCRAGRYALLKEQLKRALFQLVHELKFMAHVA